MLDRRAFLAGIGVLVLTPLIADAQQAVRIHSIGFLGPTSAAAATHLLDAFREGLVALGYVEGENVRIESRWADGNFGRLTQLASELVAAGVEVIVTPTPPAVRAAKDATTTIPIVMLNVADPVGAGLISDLILRNPANPAARPIR